jgi:hypothetical protein
MINVYNKYQENQNSITQKQPSKHTLEHIKAHHEQLYNELFD